MPKLPKTLSSNVREPAEGTQVLLIALNYWGKGATVAEAWAQLKRISRSIGARSRMLAYHVDPESTVGEVDGSISYPLDGIKPTLVARLNVRPGSHEIL